MATTLTSLAASKAAGQNQSPQLVAKVHGYDYLIGLGSLYKYTRIGDDGLLIGDGWTIGGLSADSTALDIINLKNSSRSLSQQIVPDKGGAASVPSFALNLVDVAEAMTRLISPGVILDDILGTRVDLYLGYQQTAFPQDFVRIISGIVDRTEANDGVTINIAHPEQRKRSDLFQKITTKLTAPARYRSKSILGLTYITRYDVVTDVTVTYTTGAVKGSEVVTVVGTNITVQVDASGTNNTDQSTADDVRQAIENSLAALSLVTVSVDDDAGLTIQTAYGTTTLDSDLTINVDDTTGFLLPSVVNGFRTYVRIEDEVIQYTGLTATTLTGCTRAALAVEDNRARGAHHKTDETVESFYRLEGSALVMALRLLMSGAGAYPTGGIDVGAIGNVEGVTTANAVYFDGVDLSVDYGLTIGDYVNITGDIDAGNNLTLAVVSDIVKTVYGSYLLLGAATLVESLNSAATMTITSKYDVLPAGCGLGLTGEEVDVPKFEEINDRFSASILTYDFYLKDTVTAEDFINTQILFTTGAYPIPRLGKTSIAYNSPPFGTADLVRLDEHNTQDPKTNKIVRSINKFFYNAVVYAFNEAVVDERMLTGQVDVDTVSRARIRNTGSRPLIVTCGGVRPTAENLVIIDILKQRFKDKYRFGAETIEVKSFYGDTFNADVGDPVIFGSGLNLADTKSGSRTFVPRIWDVINKSLSIETGDVKLSLLDSAYSLQDARYGVISPSSLCGAGSTTTAVKVKNSYDIVAPRTEDQKWRSLTGVKLQVHSPDWSVVGETYLTGIDPSDRYSLLVDPPLVFAALEDYVVDVASYPDNADAEDHALAKALYVFVNPSVAVDVSIGATSCGVAVGEEALFRVGAVIVIHNADFSQVSAELKVTNVVGQTVSFDVCAFVPTTSHTIELIGYKDTGAPYRFF